MSNLKQSCGSDPPLVEDSVLTQVTRARTTPRASRPSRAFVFFASSPTCRLADKLRLPFACRSLLGLSDAPMLSAQSSTSPCHYSTTLVSHHGNLGFFISLIHLIFCPNLGYNCSAIYAKHLPDSSQLRHISFQVEIV